MGGALTLAWEGSDGRQVECEAPGFDELYEAHHRRVYRLALLLCGGEVALAEDVVSEEFARVFPKWHDG